MNALTASMPALAYIHDFRIGAVRIQADRAKRSLPHGAAICSSPVHSDINHSYHKRIFYLHKQKITHNEHKNICYKITYKEKKMEILRVTDLKKTYGTGDTAVEALKGVNLSVDKGEFIAIVGTSGSGKSTLLHMLGGLDRPTSGTVSIDGKDIFTLKDEELTIFRRRKIGFVFQSFNLVPVLSVYENIVLPIELDGNTPDKEFVDTIIDTLGLSDKRDSYPNQLSGGQQQRVAIARALSSAPQVILADEPTGNLDSKTSQDVMGLLKVMGERFPQTIIVITHNEEIAQTADRIIRIEDGLIADKEVLTWQKKNA